MILHILVALSPTEAWATSCTSQVPLHLNDSGRVVSDLQAHALGLSPHSYELQSHNRLTHRRNVRPITIRLDIDAAPPSASAQFQPPTPNDTLSKAVRGLKAGYEHGMIVAIFL
jgi:hypothetical protein